MDQGDSRVTECLDGGAQDWTVSSDAMRWSPRRAARREPEFAGVDVSTGLGAVLHVDPATLRRLVARAVTPFAEVAADMLDELRGLGRPAPGRVGRRPAGP